MGLLPHRPLTTFPTPPPFVLVPPFAFLKGEGFTVYRLPLYADKSTRFGVACELGFVDSVLAVGGLVGVACAAGLPVRCCCYPCRGAFAPVRRSTASADARTRHALSGVRLWWGYWGLFAAALALCPSFVGGSGLPTLPLDYASGRRVQVPPPIEA